MQLSTTVMKARSGLRRCRWCKVVLAGILSFIFWILVSAWRILSFSSVSSAEKADAAVVLGASLWNGRPSPIFEERIKHGISLYFAGDVDYLLLTGGIAEGATVAESEAARTYAINQGVSPDKILVEQKSRITYENLLEACRLMQAEGLQTALIVSDPLHMKRAMQIAADIGMDAYPSPTTTSRYQTWRSKSFSLAYELFFYTLHMASKLLGQIESC